ncbi:hypothetical protein [Leminorella grimontii]|uniref:hypothetical protein n=1 Tax=Leminorella grimontii TaxID=82981 RepID=UPI00321FCED0
MKTFIECQGELEQIVNEFLDHELILNEAQTRFHILDRVVIDCLNWSRDVIQVEKCEDRKFTDYELGIPRQVVWEAKREGQVFTIPAGLSSKLIMDIPSLCAGGNELKYAVEQAQNYCSRRGAPIAVVSNGHQFIAFIASTQNGQSPLEGKALVFTSLQHLYENFFTAWNMLSFEGVKEKRLIRHLGSDIVGMPRKMSSLLMKYPRVRYATDLQSSLRQLSDIIIQDALEGDEIEELFYKNCYCESGVLSKYSLLSKNLLRARYAALFSESEVSPLAVPVKQDKNTQSIDPSIFAESISKRPIVLIGDVGVGKTSFVKNLMYSSAYEEFKDAIYIYIDLGSKATLSTNLKSFVLNEIETQLLEKYSTDVNERKFVKGVYAKDIQRFSSGIWGGLRESNREKYDEKQMEMLQEKITNKDTHLQNSIAHLANLTKKQIVVCIDNADQRDFDTQQDAFIISQELAKNWNSLVFVSVRPQTFFKSKASGALTAYPHKVFTISPPRIDLVVEKRLQFALEMSEGKIPLEKADFVKINVGNLTTFIRVLLNSLRDNKSLGEFLENITGGNIRQALSFITGFIGSPNVEADKIISTYEDTGRYIIPVHEFSKQALLGDYAHFDPRSSIAMNIFDISQPDNNEHFLIPILLAFLAEQNESKDRDGFETTFSILNELQSFGFIPSQIENSLRRTTNKRLIETSQRFTFEEDETGLIGEMPDKFRITSVGLYHLKRWISDFAYLDAMLFDTPIFDENTCDTIRRNIESFQIEDRYERAIAFKSYLLIAWHKMISKPTYFNFSGTLEKDDSSSFENVRKAIQRQKE